jgi:DNA gyrase subunit A
VIVFSTAEGEKVVSVQRVSEEEGDEDGDEDGGHGDGQTTGEPDGD